VRNTHRLHRVADHAHFEDVYQDDELHFANDGVCGLFNLADRKYWWWSDVRGLPSDSAVKDAYSQPGRNLSVSLTMQF
jgi:hypothetical protein